jgi:CheY-like chemotaxis protein
MTTKSLRVLLIDDDPHVGAGIRRALYRDFHIETAEDAVSALIRLRDDAAFHVVVCDLRMPGMDGLTLLANVRRYWPSALLIMLTGEAQLQHAVDALNSGLVFRFLIKPCKPETLKQAIQAAREQLELQHVEQDVMEHTWRGSIRALMDVLAIVQPAAFGRADRLAALAEELAEELELSEPWRVVTSARLTQLGAVSLSAELLQKLEAGKPLSAQDERDLEGLPATAARLLEHIPRLDAIRQILTDAAGIESTAVLSVEAAIVRVALRLDALFASNSAGAPIPDDLGTRSGKYPRAVIDAVQRRFTRPVAVPETRKIPLSEVRQGMTLASDVRTPQGLLLAARGQMVTASLIDRVEQHWATFADTQMVEVAIEPGGVATSEALQAS